MRIEPDAEIIKTNIQCACSKQATNMKYFLDCFWAAESNAMISTVFSSLRFAVSWQPPPQPFFRFRNIFWMRDAATILIDDSLSNIGFSYNFS